MTFLKVATPRMDEEQHEADVQYPMIDLARDGLISVVEHRPLKLSAVRWPICPTVSRDQVTTERNAKQMLRTRGLPILVSVDLIASGSRQTFLSVLSISIVDATHHLK